MIKLKFTKKFKLSEGLLSDFRHKRQQQRAADLIHQQLATLIKKEVHDPRLTTISLTAVSISSDLKQAKVFYTLLEDQNPQKVQKVLDKAIGYLQCLLAKATVLRYVPKLQFAYDESIARADEISLLIKRAIQNGSED